MVIVDFRDYFSLDDCPIWWKNFVILRIKETPSFQDQDLTSSAYFNEFDKILMEYNIKRIGPVDCGLDAIEFQSEIEKDEFILFWTLYGK
jgi:hypothetical protein